MSVVSGSDRLITSPDDIRAVYDGVGAGNSKLGVEVELAFFERNTGRFMTKETNKALRNAVQCQGVTLNIEPFCDGVEISTIAMPFSQMECVIDDAMRKTIVTMDEARKLGVKRSFFEHAPQTSTDDLLNNIIDVERFHTFFVPPRPDMIDIARYFVGSKSVQCSVSYETLDHLLINMRRLAFLSPFLFMLTDNSCRFTEGRRSPINTHPGMTYRASLGELGGIPPYIFTAQSGEEMIEHHITNVFDGPLFTYFDETDKQIRLPNEQWTSFRKLAERGLNTERNYYLAQSILWRDIAIRPLKDAAGETVIGHRFEARMFGTGMHQPQTAALITGGLAFLDSYGEAVDALLKTHGFDVDNPAASQTLLQDAYHHAQHHKGRFFDIPYGTGSMTDFARQFADITEEFYNGMEWDHHLTPLLHICRSGMTDARINWECFSTLDEVITFQKKYDESWLESPDFCNDLLFSEKGKPCATLLVANQ